MRDEAVDDLLAALKLILDWFVTNKMIKNFYTDLYAEDDLLFLDNDSADVTSCCNKIDILSVNRNNINLGDNFDKNDSDVIILIRL